MLVTGWVSSRIGGQADAHGRAGPIAVFGRPGRFEPNTIGQIVGFRAGWGLGNALFIATSLAVIVDLG